MPGFDAQPDFQLNIVHRDRAVVRETELEERVEPRNIEGIARRFQIVDDVDHVQVSEVRQ